MSGSQAAIFARSQNCLYLFSTMELPFKEENTIESGQSSERSAVQGRDLPLIYIGAVVYMWFCVDSFM